jgi:hypothetical protein
VAGLEDVEEAEEEDAVVAEAEASKLKASGGTDVWQLPSQNQTLTGPEEAFTARVNGQCLGYPMEAHQHARTWMIHATGHSGDTPSSLSVCVPSGLGYQHETQVTLCLSRQATVTTMVLGTRDPDQVSSGML